MGAEFLRKKSLRKLAVCTVLALGAIAVLWFLIGPNGGPVYQGKSVSAWILELPNHPTGSSPMQEESVADQAVRTFGTNALPYLVKAAEVKDSFLGRAYQRLWLSSPTVRSKLAQPVYRSAVRREALSKIGELASHSVSPVFSEAVPMLVRVMNDPEPNGIRVAAVNVLSQLAIKHGNEQAVTGLIEGLRSDYPEVRSHAAHGFTAAGPEAKQAIPMLANLLEDSDSSVRINAALAVYKISGKVEKPVEVLISALRDPGSTDGGNAAYHLSLIGPSAKQAIPELVKHLEDTDDYPRKWARMALEKIDPDQYAPKAPTLESLVAQLSSSEEDVRFNAAAGQLGEMGSKAADAVPRLLEAMRLHSRDDLWVLADAILKIDPNQAPAVVPAMINLLRNANAMNPHMGAVVLGRAGSGAKEAIPQLAMAIEQPKSWIRVEAAAALFKVGADQELKKRALEVLVDCLDPKHEHHLRGRAAILLTSIGEESRQADDPLRPAIDAALLEYKSK